MTIIDKILQYLRIRTARPYMASNARVLDIGCGDGTFLSIFSNKYSEGVGIDPTIETSKQFSNYKLVKGAFPEAIVNEARFDIITLFAVLEHIPTEKQNTFASQCSHLLNPDGYLIITVPSQKSDAVLDLLKKLKLIDGMQLDEHYGFDASSTEHLFHSSDLKLIKSKKFQFGFNNLFIFKKILL